MTMTNITSHDIDVQAFNQSLGVIDDIVSQSVAHREANTDRGYISAHPDDVVPSTSITERPDELEELRSLAKQYQLGGNPQKRVEVQRKIIVLCENIMIPEEKIIEERLWLVDALIDTDYPAAMDLLDPLKRIIEDQFATNNYLTIHMAFLLAVCACMEYKYEHARRMLKDVLDQLVSCGLSGTYINFRVRYLLCGILYAEEQYGEFEDVSAELIHQLENLANHSSDVKLCIAAICYLQARYALCQGKYAQVVRYVNRGRNMGRHRIANTTTSTVFQMVELVIENMEKPVLERENDDFVKRLLHHNRNIPSWGGYEWYFDLLNPYMLKGKVETGLSIHKTLYTARVEMEDARGALNTLCMAANILLETKRYAAALYHYCYHRNLENTKAGTYYPWSVVAYNMGKCYEALGQKATARLEYGRALIWDRSILGDQHPSTRDSKEAVERLISAHDLVPPDEWHRLHIANRRLFEC